ncbi:MAG: divergent PAP2 family protein [Clostridia bacterium]|nr:divergent PAP2 family protein [Clostridia bacterium]
MNFISALCSNPYLLSCLCAWLTAQTVKTVIHAVIHKKLEIRRLFGDGGMPSGHTATVTALAATCGLNAGFDSAVFAVSAILTVVVCRDAVGVRRETEKQAKLLNKVVDTLNTDEKAPLSDEPLNIFIGHTPLQIAVGALIGIGVAVILHFLVL